MLFDYCAFDYCVFNYCAFDYCAFDYCAFNYCAFALLTRVFVICTRLFVGGTAAGVPLVELVSADDPDAVFGFLKQKYQINKPNITTTASTINLLFLM